jgi:hypothetical protein
MKAIAWGIIYLLAVLFVIHLVIKGLFLLGSLIFIIVALVAIIHVILGVFGHAADALVGMWHFLKRYF